MIHAKDADRHLDALEKQFTPVEPGDFILHRERGYPYKRAITLGSADAAGQRVECVSVSLDGELCVGVEQIVIGKFTPVVNKRDYPNMTL